jgi:GMP synthase (glutamine-hydrolysing)
VIESVSFTGGPSVTIKSHHNVGGLPERMKLKLVEPLRELFKDEVRARSAASSGCPSGRSSGAIRSPGRASPSAASASISPRTLEIAARGRRDLSRGDPAGLYDKIWQAFAVLLPVQTVGVMGDGRTYDFVVRPARRHLGGRHDGRLVSLPTMVLGRDVDPHHQRGQVGVNRVVYDVSSKPPGTIEWDVFAALGHGSPPAENRRTSTSPSTTPSLVASRAIGAGSSPSRPGRTA